MTRSLVGTLFFALFSLTLAGNESCPKRLGAQPVAGPRVRSLGIKPASFLVSQDGAALYVSSDTGEIWKLDPVTLSSLPFERQDNLRPYHERTLLAGYQERVLGVTGSFLIQLGGSPEGYRLLKHLAEPAKAIATAPATGRIAVASESGSVIVYRTTKPGSLTSLEEEHRFELPRSWPFSWNPFLRDSAEAIALSPDGNSLAVAFKTRTRSVVYVWALDTGKVRFSLTRDKLRTEEGHLSSMDGNPDCTALGFVDDETLYTAWSTYRSFFQNWVEKIFFWKMADGSLVKNIGHSHFTQQAPFPGNITSVAFSPDKKAVALGRSGSLAFFPRVSVHAISRERLATLVGHGDPVAFVAFSPNENDFFSLSASGELVRWDAKRILASRQERLSFPGPFLIDPMTARIGGRVIEDSGE